VPTGVQILLPTFIITASTSNQGGIMEKVLVACPTYEGKKYCLDKYIEGIRALTYPNFDVLLVDNSKSEDYYNLIKSKGIPVIRAEWFEGARDRIVHSRNLIREKVLKDGYDYLFSLEQDVVPQPDTIQKLLRHKKEIVSGVVPIHHIIDGKKIIKPMIYVDSSVNKGKLNYIHPKELEKPQLIRIKACALACVLIHRDVLKDITFRYAEGFDDMTFCRDVQEKSHNIYVDTTVTPRHYVGSWKGVRK
jgi:GT2 family glycosyltransferase